MVDRPDGEFVTSDNESLYWQGWVPEEPKALNLFIHGGFSHSGNARFIARALADAGIATYAYDLRGWGHWEKTPGHIQNREQYIDDTKTFLDFIKTRHPELSVILTAHSMGGLVGLRFLIDYQNEFNCAAFSAPWMGTKVPVSGFIRFMSKILYYIWPTYSDEPDFEIEVLSHDNAVIEQHFDDQEQGLRKETATVRWLLEMEKLQKETMEDSPLITLPILMFQGGQDLIVDEEKTRQVFNQLGSDKKKWEYYSQFYHEVFNEEEREDPLNKTISFIDKHLAATLDTE